MESNYHEDEENNDLGVGRSYECMFCKRGFNTAQALGGHMNIHRKDRARNKPKQDDGGSKFYRQQISSSPLQPPLSDAIYFPVTTSSNSTLYGSNCYLQKPSNPVIPGDWRSMRFSHLESNSLPMDQDKELNLELRLGYD